MKGAKKQNPAIPKLPGQWKQSKSSSFPKQGWDLATSGPLCFFFAVSERSQGPCWELIRTVPFSSESGAMMKFTVLFGNKGSKAIILDQNSLHQYATWFKDLVFTGSYAQ